jgi:hypothetical protein
VDVIDLAELTDVLRCVEERVDEQIPQRRIPPPMGVDVVAEIELVDEPLYVLSFREEGHIHDLEIVVVYRGTSGVYVLLLRKYGRYSGRHVPESLHDVLPIEPPGPPGSFGSRRCSRPCSSHRTSHRGPVRLLRSLCPCA